MILCFILPCCMFSCGGEEQDIKSPPVVTITIKEKKKLQIKHYPCESEESYIPSTEMWGILQVIFTNKSDSALSLFAWDTHNIVFRKRGGKSEAVPVHICDCVGLFRGGGTIRDVQNHWTKYIVSLMPGGKYTVNLDGWMCDGGAFGSHFFPEMYSLGKHDINYRALPLNTALKRIQKAVDSYSSGGFKQGIGKGCAAMLTSAEFWEGAYISNTITIEWKAKPHKKNK